MNGNRGIVVGMVGLVLSAVFMAGVHIVGSGQIDVVGTTLSALVFVDGHGWMFAASVLAMAAAAVGLIMAVAHTRLRADSRLRVALWVTAVCCLLVAVFPTNRSGPLTLSDEIHRYAAGVAFFCVPVAALLVRAHLDRDSPHRRWLLRGAVGVAGLLLIFLTSHFGVVPEVQAMNGAFQRVMFVLQLGILALLLHGVGSHIRKWQFNPTVSPY